MKLPKHCPRYSASRGFMPGLKDWRTVRAQEPGLLDVPEARTIRRCRCSIRRANALW